MNILGTRYSFFLIVLLFLLSGVLPATARRGNPANTAQPRIQFYVVDSDDDSPLRPTPRFLDTTQGSWLRVTGFNNTDDGYSEIPMTYDSVDFMYYNLLRRLFQPAHSVGQGTDPGRTVSTNGTITLNGNYPTPVNVLLPTSAITKDLIAPLWADWEFRTTGDSSKVYVRAVHMDTFYVSYYNLALKGTNGQVRATFQVVFTPGDTSITFQYRSFDGSFNGVPAAALIQRVVTIGMQNIEGNWGTTYLHKGTYLAQGSSAQYSQNLHNGLAVKFLRKQADAFQILSITTPPTNRYEMTTNTFTPSGTFANLTDTTEKIFIRSTMVNALTGATFYSRFDSLTIDPFSSAAFSAAQFNGLPCGTFRLTMTATFRNNVPDAWEGNNTMTRTFVSMNTLPLPFREEFNTLNTCNWSWNGAEIVNAYDYFYTSPPTYNGGSPKALLLNRVDANRLLYLGDGGGDTLTSGPMNLAGHQRVYLTFYYQRGKKSDTSSAGALQHQLFGPEIGYTRSGNTQVPDSLVIEGLTSSGSTYNPSPSAWTTISVITGGLDVSTQTYRVQLPAAYLHDHFRLRLRVKAHDNSSVTSPTEDLDNFLVDAIRIDTLLQFHSELEPIDIDLGNGPYTHIPRDLSNGVIPKVRIMNNGDAVSLGISNIRLEIRDALNRLVYDKTKGFSFPQPLADSVFPMLIWDIHGSEGGLFTAKVTLSQTLYDTYHANDTMVFYKTMYIDDRYALDDETPDALGSRVTADTEFTLTFTPLGTDTLRGVEFYYTAAGTGSTWTIAVRDTGNTVVNRTTTITPTGAGFFRGSFTPLPLHQGLPYQIHFVMTTGSHLGGDASNGLVTYSGTSGYAEVHPEVLSLFNYTPTDADVDQGGKLLPMVRLITSGSSVFLPVKLAAINATRLGDGSVSLRWATTMEENAYNFEIRRVDDNMLVTTARAKNATNGASYAAHDAVAPATAVTYELIEQDLDGSRQSLGRVTASAFAPGSIALSLQAYPNPSHNLVTVKLTKPVESLSVIDPLGRTLMSFGATASELKLDLSAFAPGTYYVVASAQDETARIPVTVVK